MCPTEEVGPPCGSPTSIMWYLLLFSLYSRERYDIIIYKRSRTKWTGAHSGEFNLNKDLTLGVPSGSDRPVTSKNRQCFRKCKTTVAVCLSSFMIWTDG